MNRQLEPLLKAFEAFMEAPRGPEATRLEAVYDTKLEETSELIELPKETLDRMVRRYFPRRRRQDEKKVSSLPPKA